MVCALAFALAVPLAAQAATLTVRIGGVAKEGGVLRLALYDRQSYEGRDGKPVARLVVRAMPGETVAVMKDVPPGTYALKTFQDETGGGKMKFNFLGMPEWPYGFSNDAVPVLSQPPFDKAAFTLPAVGTTITLHLR
jgi:uncharacterized protein (DUF2141 family)